MGSISTESFEAFLESLKQAGIAITNEAELRERLAEAQRWRYAFMTLAANGRSLGIRFEDQGIQDAADIRRTLAQFQFPEGTEAILAASFKAH
ncbi:MAG: hypothetical protein M0P39_04565 [Rhodocyclaceae bacterium]|nr:hypothetical protein [Rhodocyclaceae bacterium]